jgi:hypothetical protein
MGVSLGARRQASGVSFSFSADGFRARGVGSAFFVSRASF